MRITELQTKTNEELIELASSMGALGNGPEPRRQELLMTVLKAHAEKNGQIVASGILSIVNDGYGFLKQNGTASNAGDVYVSQSQIRRFGLRTGDEIAGQVRPPKDGERYFGLVRVEVVNGVEPDTARSRPKFESLTPVFPTEMIKMEASPKQLSTRLIDMLAPTGRGQRGLIVSPPKAGKTTILKQMANSITVNAPDIQIMVALIGERPEEVTDMRRSVHGEVYSSTFDEPVEDHCRVAEMVLERAKRMVESGRDVVVLLDSITRLTRAALYPPKRFFGAARNTEEGGSLTILAACLVDTGSRMDDVVYEEFKGTGNMEIHLDRKLSESRIFPAIDIAKSGTRREELLLDEATLKQVWVLRRMVTMIASDTNKSSEANEKLLERLRKTRSNQEFLSTLGR